MSPKPTKHKPIGGAEISAGGLVKTLDVLSDPLSSLAAAAEATGLSSGAAKRMVKRVQAQYQPMLQEKREYKTSELLELLTNRAGRALEWMDDYIMSRCSRSGSPAAPMYRWIPSFHRSAWNSFCRISRHPWS